MKLTAPRRKYETPFDPVTFLDLGMVHEHIHVDGQREGPSVVPCKRCSLWFVPIALTDRDAVAVVNGHAPKKLIQGVSAWSCFVCRRVLTVTWSVS